MKAPRRFAFGANWHRYLHLIDDSRIAEAEQSIVAMLDRDDLQSLTLLDIGCGSGLFSLAAHRLGAQVISFDYDSESVACTTELKRRHSADSGSWRIFQGSILDRVLVDELGNFDVVYSWGVLHHTGDMWRALKNTCYCVADNGQMFIAIYNDQGWRSRNWLAVKRFYNRCPAGVQRLVEIAAAVRLLGPTVLRDLLTGRPLQSLRNYKSTRGMSPWYDVVDWVGGYPFEVAKPEQIQNFCRNLGFQLVREKTVGGGHGCNEFVFRRTASGRDA